MVNNYSYPDEFKNLLKKINNKSDVDLLEIDGIGQQLDINEFSKKFFSKIKATADVSVDANANIEDVTLLQYNAEMTKPIHRLNSLFLLWKYARELYSIDMADEFVRAQLTKEIYINDFGSFQTAYCFNFSCMDVVYNGLPFTRKVVSEPAKNLSAFMGQMINFITYAGNNIAGACGVADLLICASWYVDKLRNESTGISKAFLDKQIKQEIQSFIYSVNQPFRGGIQCVDEETELLTPNGFKKYSELGIGDDTYTWNNGKLEIQKIKKMNIANYRGEMHKYSGRDCEFSVTPNHRILHKKNNSTEYEIHLSEELINEKTPLTIPITCSQFDREDYAISDELLQLITIVLTDGCISAETGKSPRISMFKSKNRDGGKLIKELCEELNLNYHLSTRLDGFEHKHEVEVFRLTVDSSKEICSMLNNTKTVLPNWFTKLSRRQANLVVDTWVKFDGNINTQNYDNYRLQCDNNQIADQLQHICFIAGYGSRINKRLISNNKTETIYVVPFKRINKSCSNKEKFYYDGVVWCPTVDNGIVVFRKNGAIFVSGNSFFTNVSVFDGVFLADLCNQYSFPDGSKANIETVKELQLLYIDLMNEVLEKSPATFPVTTAAFAVNDNLDILDKEFLQIISEKNIKYGFMNLFAGKIGVLSSCCRLRNDGATEYFNSFGSGSTKIGSLGVVTLNLPRIAHLAKNREDFLDKVQDYTELAARINNTKRYILKKRIASGHYPLYTFGFMDIKRQYSTCGLVGINEAIEILKLNILEKEGQQLVLDMLDIINKVNSIQEKKYKFPHNVEQVPAETAAVKLAEVDRTLGFNKNYHLYSNQFIPLITKADIYDRMKLQGLFDKHMTGGAICHLNVVDRIEDVNYMATLIEKAVKMGVVYFAINYNLQDCKNHHITVGKNTKCPTCGEPTLNDYVRVVGFLVNTKNFHPVRRSVDYPNRQWYGKDSLKCE